MVDKSYILLINGKGDISGEYTFDHGIYHVMASENSNKFMASSDDLELYLYDTEGRCLGMHNLGYHGEEKGYIRCVDISPEGKFILYTNANKVFLMDLNFNEIASWKTPNKEERDSELLGEGWERKPYISEECKEYLSLLGISGRPTPEEIRKAFKNKIRKHHPDFNPDDPKAKETTIAVIEAYEKLTGEEARRAFSGDENADYYYNMIHKIKWFFRLSCG
jgi:WD40 repeat protein